MSGVDDALKVTRTELGSPLFWKRLEESPARLAAEICFVDLVNLDQTLQRHSSLRAWLNATHETARGEEERAAYAVTIARARALLKAKETDDPHTGKAKTVQVLKAEEEVDAEVQAAEQAHMTAREKRGALRAMVDGLEDRVQMLVQISANRRKEEQDSNRR